MGPAPDDADEEGSEGGEAGGYDGYGGFGGGPDRDGRVVPYVHGLVIVQSGLWKASTYRLCLPYCRIGGGR